MNSGTRAPVHYGWVIVFVGMLGVLASIGLGRFALGMLLPSMGEALGLTYSQMGFISTANFVGYLASVLLSGFLAARVGPRRVIVAGLVMVGASMMLMGLAGSFTYALVLYTVTGLGTGSANVPIMGLVAAWFSRKLRGRAAGFIVIGSSFAIIISGKLVPFVNGLSAQEGWRISWALLGAMVLVIAFVSMRFLLDRPSDAGLTPVGSGAAPPRKFNAEHRLRGDTTLYHLGFIYFLFGFTYVIYATFLVTALIRQWGYTEPEAGSLWAWIGFLSLLSGPVFGTLSDTAGRKAGLVAVFFFQGLAYFLVGAGLPAPYLYVSIAAYGVVAWSVPSIMAACAGDYFGAERAPQAFGIMTFIFALGQVAGPALAGMLAEASGTFGGSFYLAAALAVAAAVASMFLRKPRER